MKLSEELESWAKFATMSQRGREQHGEMAFKAAQLENWMRWILHLHCDIGKGGGPSTNQEWEECLAQGQELLSAPDDTPMTWEQHGV